MTTAGTLKLLGIVSEHVPLFFEILDKSIRYTLWLFEQTDKSLIKFYTKQKTLQNSKYCGTLHLWVKDLSADVTKSVFFYAVSLHSLYRFLMYSPFGYFIHDMSGWFCICTYYVVRDVNRALVSYGIS